MKYQLRLLFFGFIVSFLVVLSLTTISFVRINKLDSRIALVEHTYRVINSIDLLSDDIQNLNRSSFRYVTTGDQAILQLYRKYDARWDTVADSLKRLTNDNTSSQAGLIILKSDMALYRAQSAQLMDTVPLSATDFVTSKTYLERRRNADSMTARLDRMGDGEFELLRLRTAERQSYLQITSSLIRALTFVFGLLTAVLFFGLLREFRRRVAYQTELQQKVTEIAQSKRELEHIAYATSHDLQEPLRKIRILTDRWQSNHRTDLSADDRDLMERITGSAARMQELVGELMTLASLNEDRPRSTCSLRNIADSAASELAEIVAAKSADLRIEDLPIVRGYSDQLKLLFRHLLDNALKFSRPDVPTHIRVSSHDASGAELSADNSARYLCIVVEDNGIGFDNRQSDKMFGIFRQLHSDKEGYSGRGTGLAICQRIMHNHHGAIIAHGFPSEGATFKLYFPVG